MTFHRFTFSLSRVLPSPPARPSAHERALLPPARPSPRDKKHAHAHRTQNIQSDRLDSCVAQTPARILYERFTTSHHSTAGRSRHATARVVVGSFLRFARATHIFCKFIHRPSARKCCRLLLLLLGALVWLIGPLHAPRSHVTQTGTRTPHTTPQQDGARTAHTAKSYKITRHRRHCAGRSDSAAAATSARHKKQHIKVHVTDRKGSQSFRFFSFIFRFHSLVVCCVCELDYFFFSSSANKGKRNISAHNSVPCHGYLLATY